MCGCGRRFSGDLLSANQATPDTSGAIDVRAVTMGRARGAGGVGRHHVGEAEQLVEVRKLLSVPCNRAGGVLVDDLKGCLHLARRKAWRH